MRRLVLLSSLLTLSLAACDRPDREAPAPATAPATDAASTPQAALRLVIESATWSSSQPAAPAERPASETPSPETPAPKMPRPELVRAQILLDRAHFSPGIVDGFGGENTRQAVAAYEEAAGLPVDGELDAEVFARLTDGASPVLVDYTLTPTDVAGPFNGPVPADLEAMSRLDVLAYATPLEALAEKFHVSEALIASLNPGVDFGQAGQTLIVPAVSNAALPEVTRIVVDKTESTLRAFDAEGRLLAFYPATIGSPERPAPSGTVTVVGIAPEPNYTYDPARVSYDRGDRRLVIPAGPNNPVGSVWIDLSRDTYGIHGTPDPSKIAKTQSNGCVRLTNWSAEQLAASVKPGVEVEFD